MTRKQNIRALLHPGEMLAEHFMAGHGVTAYRVAVDIGLRPPVIYELIAGKRSVTAPLALRLGRYFGTTPPFWINLQSEYDLGIAEAEVGAAVRKSVRPLAA
jgi:addiction module HigA family antidote